MSELTKLKKQEQKACHAVAAARGDIERAIEAYETAVAARAVAREQLEQAEALEAARELRKSK